MRMGRTAEVIVLVVVHTLHSNDIGSVCRARTDRSHDSDKNMFLDGEGTGVEGDTEDFDVRHKSSPSSTDREGQQLRDNLQVVYG